MEGHATITSGGERNYHLGAPYDLAVKETTTLVAFMETIILSGVVAATRTMSATIHATPTFSNNTSGN
jgi:hypothetical protein